MRIKSFKFLMLMAYIWLIGAGVSLYLGVNATYTLIITIIFQLAACVMICVENFVINYPAEEE